MHDVGVVRGAVAALMRHIAVNGKEAARAFPKNKEKTAGVLLIYPPRLFNLGTAVPHFSPKAKNSLASACRRCPHCS